MYASKTYAVNFSAVAAGDGYWGMKAGTVVNFSELSLSVNKWDEDDDFSASLNATHDADASKYGLCYTDKGIEAAVNAFIQQHDELSKLIASVSGSEQGMQDDDVLNCDVAMRGYVDVATLQALGFDVDDEDEADWDE